MNAQHTPGHWTYGDERRSHVEPRHRQVTAPHADNGPIRKRIATVYYGETAAEREANAQLIAAAPEMLSALEMAHGVIYEALNRRGGKLALSRALIDICNVLAKAKGEVQS